MYLLVHFSFKDIFDQKWRVDKPFNFQSKYKNVCQYTNNRLYVEITGYNRTREIAPGH